MLLAKEISTTLWVLITIFNCEWLPSRSLLTTCECKHSWDPLLERSLHRSLNSCPWIYNNCHESLAFVLFPDIVYVVVFQCLNHWAMVGTIFLLSLWNCSDFIVNFMTYMLKVVWMPLVYNDKRSLLLITKSLKSFSWIVLYFCNELAKEEINSKMVSLQIVITWHGSDMYVYLCVFVSILVNNWEYVSIVVL